MKYLILVFLNILTQSIYAVMNPINLDCSQGNTKEISPIIKFISEETNEYFINDPMLLLMSVAVHQRYQGELNMEKINTIQKNKQKNTFPYFYSLKDISEILELSGFRAQGYIIDNNAKNIGEGEVGFLLDSHMFVNSQPVYTLLFSATNNERYLLYADGIICPLEKDKFEKRFSKSFYLRLS
ncbi:hypothetical protein [Acinetobacter sp.]|jgi:hypothetical protein|uniref:hypothetical protein n=1 Tax=Acinetobacter sp. TaxID=472 RepID=UPI002822BA76|nr:hypothetical protein [Acinetobacter sp.]MDR0235734.1 hypothetical protein [Acinetobacter sp.]